MPALELLISNKKLGQVGEETLFGEAYFGGYCVHITVGGKLFDSQIVQVFFS